MIPLKTVFLGILAVNSLTLLVISYCAYFLTGPPRITTSIQTPPLEHEEDPLTFDDPIAAYDILSQLDLFQPIDAKYYLDIKPDFTKPKYGLKIDNKYCEKHRAYFAENPEFIFNERNFITNQVPATLIRGKAIKIFGSDIMPFLGDHMPENQKNASLYDLRLDASVFLILAGLHQFQQLGKQFGCLTQMYNRIPGRIINRKDMLAASVVKYAKQYEDRPQCFNHDKFFPKTWVMMDEGQCREFFDNFNSEEYQKLKKERIIVYIRKVGYLSHQAKGVEVVNEEEEASLRKLYGNGTLCGKIMDNYILQTYVYNPLLLNGHKFDFRVYMIIASTNPLIAYYYDGFLRISLHPYDPNSKDKSVLLTNTALSHQIFDIARTQGTYQGLTETELRNLQMWNLTRLQSYLLENGIINDENWLDNYLRPQFKKAMIHLIRMTSDTFIKMSQVYELFGVDFMLDSNLNLWFIECNSGPVLTGSSEEKERFLTKMLLDEYELVFGLLKSRAKRIISYVNKLLREGQANKLASGQVYIRNLENKRREFQEVIKNRFEPEFEISAGSGLHKIIDENLEGQQRYFGLLEEECM